MVALETAESDRRRGSTSSPSSPSSARTSSRVSSSPSRASSARRYVTRRIARAAYERGAKYVDVVYFDQWVKRERIAHAAEDTLDYAPPWMSQRLLHLSDEHAARITLSGPHAPRALDGLDPARAGRDLLPYLPETGEVVNRHDDELDDRPRADARLGRARVPGPRPRRGVRAAVGRRSRTSAASTRTIRQAAWIERTATLKANADRLTERRFDALRLHGPGTDLTIGLFRSSPGRRETSSRSTACATRRTSRPRRSSRRRIPSA